MTSTIHSSGSLRQATLKKNMSITQTYYLAHKARGKLSHEAAQPDHDLRLLVGHANLLDTLMVELADAEREQERWFNQSVRGASKASNQDRHVQWADRIEEEEEDSSDSESEASDDEYDEDVEMVSAAAPAPVSRTIAVDDTMEEDDLEEDYAHLELVRTPSHSNSPPELIESDTESSDDESLPPSPVQHSIRAAPSAKDVSEQEDESLYSEDAIYLPARNPARLVTAISVY